jgi:amidase
MPVEMTLDHLGPMARTVRGIAEVLEVVAGPDGEDPRQVGSRPFRPGELTGRLDGEVSGLRVGMISEGFGWPGLSDPQVDAAVREASLSLRTLGCRVETVSIPMHRDAAHIISPIMSQGSTTLMLHGDTMGNNWRGRYLTDLQEFFHENWSSRAKEISLSAKVDLLAGEYALQAGGAPYYGMAQNLIPVLTDQYDRALAGHDLLVMPTLPMMPREFIRNELDADEFTAWALNMSANNYAANLTGHPALSVPCAVIDGLPVGIMIVGPRGHDLEVLRLGDAFQRRLFEMPPPLPPNGHQHLHMQLKE